MCCVISSKPGRLLVVRRVVAVGLRAGSLREPVVAGLVERGRDLRVVQGLPTGDGHAGRAARDEVDLHPGDAVELDELGGDRGAQWPQVRPVTE